MLEGDCAFWEHGQVAASPARRCGIIRPMRENDEELQHGTEYLREALRKFVERSGRSVRELERELGLGNGTLRNMLVGRSDLRLRHLDRLARVFDTTIRDLLAEAFRVPLPGQGGPRSRLREIVAEEVRAELAAFWSRHALRLEGSGTLARVEEIEPG